jgi:hypothetical protein
MRVGDDHVHHAVGRQRRVPGKRLVDALASRRPSSSRSSARAEAQMRSAQRHVGPDACGRPMRQPAASAGRAACSGSRRGNRWSRAGSAAGASRGRSGSRWNGPRCRASRARKPAGRSSCRAAAPHASRSMGGRARSSSKATARSRRRGGGWSGRDTGRLRHGLGRVFFVEIFLRHQFEHRPTAVRPSGSVERRSA